jgi:hypothetical protein
MSRYLAVFAMAWAFIAVSDGGPAGGQEPRHGGMLNAMQREELPVGFAIHESTTISTIWPAMPCFNNLVLFDPMKKVERADTIIGELAERWSWQDTEWRGADRCEPVGLGCPNTSPGRGSRTAMARGISAPGSPGCRAGDELLPEEARSGQGACCQRRERRQRRNV